MRIGNELLVLKFKEISLVGFRAFPVTGFAKLGPIDSYDVSAYFSDLQTPQTHNKQIQKNVLFVLFGFCRVYMICCRKKQKGFLDWALVSEPGFSDL